MGAQHPRLSSKNPFQGGRPQLLHCQEPRSVSPPGRGGVRNPGRCRWPQGRASPKIALKFSVVTIIPPAGIARCGQPAGGPAGVAPAPGEVSPGRPRLQLQPRVVLAGRAAVKGQPAAGPVPGLYLFILSCQNRPFWATFGASGPPFVPGRHKIPGPARTGAAQGIVDAGPGSIPHHPRPSRVPERSSLWKAIPAPMDPQAFFPGCLNCGVFGAGDSVQ